MIRIRYNRSGQISPLFIIIIVVLIVAVLVTINIGKVSTSKVNTANAADAGALAGASQLSCVLNFAGLMHTLSFACYTGVEIYLCIPKFVTKWPGREKKAIKWGKLTRLFFIQAKKAVEQGNKLALMDAYHYALINAGVDDQRKWNPQTMTYRRKYNPNIETWKEWLMLKSAFSEWINDLGYADHNQYPDQYHYPESTYYTRSSLEYRWRNRGDQDEELKVAINHSTFPEAKRLLLPCIGIYWVIVPPGVKVYFPLPHNLFSTTPCFMYAGFRSLVERHPWIEVGATHDQPPENLGLWTAKRSWLTSTSRAQVYKGHYWTWIFNNFDLKTIRTE